MVYRIESAEKKRNETKSIEYLRTLYYQRLNPIFYNSIGLQSRGKHVMDVPLFMRKLTLWEKYDGFPYYTVQMDNSHNSNINKEWISNNQISHFKGSL